MNWLARQLTLHSRSKAPEGRDVNNPEQAAGAARGLCNAPAFRAEQCRYIAERLCAARGAGGLPCIPVLRSASLHLHGVINITPLTGRPSVIVRAKPEAMTMR
ncbi:MAG: hypothetical protein LBF81_00250, partial [Prevotellaceae bacterium]|nr:hypothetical protein [Prevotellaceae bacterium]